MTEEEFDLALAARVKDCVAEKALPEGFADRLRLSVRRSRRMFRLELTAVIALITIFVSLVIGLTGHETPRLTENASLLAANRGATNEQVSSWMLLSVFRQCLRRIRSGKRKDDEE